MRIGVAHFLITHLLYRFLFPLLFQSLYQLEELDLLKKVGVAYL